MCKRRAQECLQSCVQIRKPKINFKVCFGRMSIIPLILVNVFLQDWLQKCIQLNISGIQSYYQKAI